MSHGHDVHESGLKAGGKDHAMSRHAVHVLLTVVVAELLR